MVDLPTPPLADETAITFLTSRMLRFSGKPLIRRGSSGGAPDRGRPYCSFRIKYSALNKAELTSGFSCCKNLREVKRRVDIIFTLFAMTDDVKETTVYSNVIYPIVDQTP